MRERLANVVAWIGFLSLVFGVIPFAVMTAGAKIEEMRLDQQGERAYFEVACDNWNLERTQATGKKQVILNQFFENGQWLRGFLQSRLSHFRGSTMIQCRINNTVKTSFLRNDVWLRIRVSCC